jgi:hemolysin III
MESDEIVAQRAAGPDRWPVEASQAIIPETTAERIANTVTHGIGAVLSIASLFAMVAVASAAQVPDAVTGVTIFGSVLVLVYLASTAYHAVTHDGARRILNFVDHSTIFLLIAGTYTPLALIVIPGGPDWTMLAIVWSLAVVGIGLRSIFGERYVWLRISFYLIMGWMALIWAPLIVAALGWEGSGLMLAGGVAYTTGIIFYLWEKLPFNHAIWHLFVIGGSVAHVCAIMFFVI